MINPEVLPSYSRYVLTSLGTLSLVCPDLFVAEIMIVDRSEILLMPFFDSAILGLVHQQGVIVPLVSLKQALLGSRVLVPEKITVVRLSDELEAIAGAGLVVDRVIGSISADQFQNMQLGASNQTEYIRLESLFTLLPSLELSAWEPYRWHPSSA
jgi:chemotaxis signal transduction protein